MPTPKCSKSSNPGPPVPAGGARPPPSRQKQQNDNAFRGSVPPVFTPSPSFEGPLAPFTARADLHPGDIEIAPWPVGQGAVEVLAGGSALQHVVVIEYRLVDIRVRPRVPRCSCLPHYSVRGQRRPQ